MHGDVDVGLVGDPWLEIHGALAGARHLQRLAIIGDSLLLGNPMRQLVEDLPCLRNIVLGSGDFEHLKDFFTLAHTKLEVMVLRDMDFESEAAAIWSCFSSCPSLKLVRIEDCEAQVSFRFRIKFSASLMMSSKGKKVINHDKVRLKSARRWISDDRCELFLRKVLNFYEQEVQSTLTGKRQPELA